MEPKKDRIIGAIFVVVGAAIWGTSGTAQALGPPEAIPITVASLRMLLGGFLLLMLAIFRGSINFDNPWPIKPVIVSIIGMAAFQPFFFTGVRLAGVAVGTIVIMGTAPVISGILSYIFLKEVPKKVWYFSTVFAITGCILLVISSEVEATADPLGVFFSLIAGFAFSIYILGSKVLLNHQAPEAVTAVIFASSAIFLMPIIFFYPIDWVFQLPGFLTILYLGVFSTVAAYLLFSAGLSKVPASTSVTLTLAEPLTAALLGFFLLGEEITSINFVGIILLFISLALLTVKTR
ncbi:DMT family transporter [Natranaerofaba carboxydovora]|uniref:DMT family transporter n=1 Tax=Natranaerofaba carboxydovora TaxID=2742683 RepID=UPI001F13DD03|nr:EamA family transporter [Natranaerofaba carboxydovora]UMZ74330.1 EamA-like transporter family protein [Natranaerofaba carboxydovora]